MCSSDLLVEALGRSREGLVGGTQSGELPVVMPAMHGASVLRWEPWVRQSVLLTTLLEGFTYAQGGLTAETANDPETVALRIGGIGFLALRRPSAAFFQAQLGGVLNMAALRADRAPEILSQIDGQWAYWGNLLPFRLGQAPTVIEWLDLTIQLCVAVEMRFKHAMACPRPHQYSVAVRPMITTPGHGTFPMGHATQVEAVRMVLLALLGAAGVKGAWLTELHTESQRLCHRISENRVVAGVHFEVDEVAGIYLGRMLGGWLSGQATGLPDTAGKDVKAHETLDAAQLWEDFGVKALHKARERAEEDAARWAAAEPLPLLAPVWAKAVDELKLLLSMG